MRQTNILIIFLLILFSASAKAQESQYRYEDATQLWHQTDNAAALTLDSTRNRGYAQFVYQHQEGDYSRVQEGSQTNQLQFQTERYQKIGKFLHAYGHFNFDYGRTNNRAWCDVMRPYNSNPFFAGSSIAGSYDFQDFDFTAALGTTRFGHWTLGVRLDYKVGDLSRLRDPRSRSQLLDYKITPAATYSLRNHTIALSLGYNRRKEKIIGLQTVQQDPSLMYYLMSGMENAEGTVGGYSSYSREWVNHQFQAELSYGLRTPHTHHLLTAAIQRGTEDSYGQYKYQPGQYVSYQYSADLRNRIHGENALHAIDLHADYTQAYADEYRQQYHLDREMETVTTTKEVTGADGTTTTVEVVEQKPTSYTYTYYSNLITFKKRYQVKQLNLQAHYRFNFLEGQQVSTYLGAALAYNDTRNERLLPSSSLHYKSTNITVEGGTQLFRHALWLDLACTYHISHQANLQLADPTTDYAQGVLIPDLPYYEANYWRAHLSLTYQFRLKIKGSQTKWFVRAAGDYLKTDNSLNASNIGFTLGLFNF